MLAVTDPLSAKIVAMMYLGDVVFAMSGALAAGRQRMDVVGFTLIGTITGIGGGTLRDVLLGRTVWWTQQPTELILCVAVSLVTFSFVPNSITRQSWVNWCDAIGLAALSVVGCHIALSAGVPPVVGVFMGVLTATGGGVIRDVLTKTKPMITDGQLYATAALLGATCYAILVHTAVTELIAELLAFLSCLLLRAAAIVFNIRMGPPGEFLRIGPSQTTNTKGENGESSD